jgi:hypothetical protein
VPRGIPRHRTPGSEKLRGASLEGIPPIHALCIGCTAASEIPRRKNARSQKASLLAPNLSPPTGLRDTAGATFLPYPGRGARRATAALQGARRRHATGYANGPGVAKGIPGPPSLPDELKQINSHSQDSSEGRTEKAKMHLCTQIGGSLCTSCSIVSDSMDDERRQDPCNVDADCQRKTR